MYFVIFIYMEVCLCRLLLLVLLLLLLLLLLPLLLMTIPWASPPAGYLFVGLFLLIHLCFVEVTVSQYMLS